MSNPAPPLPPNFSNSSYYSGLKSTIESLA